NYTVNTLVDAEADGVCDATPDGCTLRDAIALANLSANVPDTITFDIDGLPGVIELDPALATLTITDGLTIQGPGSAQLTIDANSLEYEGSVISIETTSTVSISGLTLTGGDAPWGGGIFVDEDGDVVL